MSSSRWTITEQESVNDLVAIHGGRGNVAALEGPSRRVQVKAQGIPRASVERRSVVLGQVWAGATWDWSGRRMKITARRSLKRAARSGSGVRAAEGGAGVVHSCREPHARPDAALQPLWLGLSGFRRGALILCFQKTWGATPDRPLHEVNLI